ncbi:MAG: hypothetical protein ACRBI6_08485 [Acidimicrobiales bacterium]
MTTTLRVGRVGLGAERRRHLEARRLPHPSAAAAIFLTLCTSGAMAVAAGGWDHRSDGADVVPLVALVALGLTVARWAPDGATPTRPLESTLPLALGLMASALAAALFIQPALGPELVGPVMTVALVGAYLGLWGYRALALWRTVVVFSLLTWRPVAEALHDVVRESLAEPSALVYQRLALLPMVGVDDEPWRVLSAELHRGSLVVLATVLLSFAVRRWRLDGSSLLQLGATTGAAFVVHHAVILAIPIDQYAPSEATRLATDPLLEVGIAVAAVAALQLARPDRHTAVAHAAAERPAPAEPPTVDRDPVIFAAVDAPRALGTALLTSSAVPVAALALLA